MKIKHKLVPIFFILVATVIATRELFFKGFFPMHDDMQVGRLYQMDLCFRDGQIPCRWVPDMGYSYGYPLFNFYPPFPYYLGQFFHLLGFSYINSIKLLFILGFFVSGVFIYLLTEKLWGKWGGILSSILYLLAPYHSVDVYVRGAMNEFWALAFLPGLYWSVYEVIERDDESRNRYLLFFSLFLALLLLSHNVMSFIFAPGVALFALVLIWLKKQSFWRIFFTFVKYVFLGLGMAVFFTLPVIFEQKYVHIETMLMGYFNYLAHYVSIGKLLFSRYWGYGSSSWQQTEGMPFQVGFPHWILAVATFILFIFLSFRKKTLKNKTFLVSFFFLLFLGSLFLIHPRSVFIWNRIPYLAYLQFPWRFLTLVIFAASVLGGGLIFLIKNKTKNALLALFLIIVTILLNFTFFKPAEIIDIDDTEKLFSAKGWHRLQTDAIFDYLPKSAKAPPADPAPAVPQVIEGEVEVSEVSKGTDWYRFETKGTQGVVQIPIYFFPGWKVYVDGEETDFVYDNPLGLITVSLSEGEHSVLVRLTNTPVRTAANLVSLIAWGVFFVLFVKTLRAKK